MTQALATAAFLIALWGVARLVIEMIAQDGAMVMAALRGQSMRAQPPKSAPHVTIRYARAKASVARPRRVQPQLLDAA